MSLTFAKPPAVRTLVDQLLEEQASAGTAAEHFARWHARTAAIRSKAPGETPNDRFRRLIPLSRPGSGEQYAFEVDLSRCTGCKACVAACHSLNGLDPAEAWREVGDLRVTASRMTDRPATQTVTTSCHHCLDPACAHGCPVLAYEKDAETGVVRHLDDQCIGCSYCILKFPYDAPKYNPRLGIVRKCDMCHQRLAAGEAPACVQACPTEAIAIRVVSKNRVPAAGARLVPGAFDSSYTRPTTVYVNPSPAATPADGVWSQPTDPSELPLAPAHPPLTVMLVLTQMAAGGFAAGAIARLSSPDAGEQAPLLVSAAMAGWAGLSASVLHLGQPLKAWRIFLGWRRSWLSREALVLGAFGAVAWAAVIRACLAATSGRPDSPGGDPILPVLGALLGLAGVAASGMVYIDTRRPFWSFGLVAGKFAGTTVLLGSGLAAAVWSWQGEEGAVVAAAVAWTARWVLSVWEWVAERAALKNPSCPWHVPALILRHRQSACRHTRTALFVLTGIILPTLALGFPSLVAPSLTIGLLATTLSQLIERHQFFTAAAAPHMPRPT